jgi:hypothetical protein
MGGARAQHSRRRQSTRTDPQQSSSSSSSSSLCWRRRAGGAVGTGEALGLSTGSAGAGFGNAVGDAAGTAATGTRGAATVVRGSGAASVLVADEELGGSLSLATESETVGAGSDGGSPLIAMTAIPTITPSDVAATAAATSRNMTIYRLAERARALRVGDDACGRSSLWQRAPGMAPKAPRRSWRDLDGLALIHHERPYGLHSARTPSKMPGKRFRGCDRKWVAIVHVATAASHVPAMPGLGIEWHARRARGVVGHSVHTRSCGPTGPPLEGPRGGGKRRGPQAPCMARECPCPWRPTAAPWRDGCQIGMGLDHIPSC